MSKSKKTRKPKVDVTTKELKEPSKTRAQLKSLVSRQVDGKLHNKHGVKSIDELLGARDSVYRDFKTEAEYEEFLSNLNLTDLQEHATKVPIMPKEDRASLIKALVADFRLKTSAYYGAVEQNHNFPKAISPEVERILADGR